MESNKINVLAVDDIETNLTSLEAVITDPQINLVKAHSGEEALSLMLDYDFALVLLDVQMPGMNGFETAEYMKKSEKTKYIPIIFITAISKEDEYICSGYRKGAVDYMLKPINPDILDSKIRVFMELYLEKRKAMEYSILLERKIDELEKSKEANNLKDQFLANISHELRTPLNAIIGISKMMGKYNTENLNNDQKSGLTAISKSGERLLAIINDILDLSKIESGKTEITNSPFSLTDFIVELKNMTEKLIVAEGKSISVNIKLDETVKYIISDEKKLLQILTNLLGNAVKFTESGAISLDVDIKEQNIYFTVKDTGIGIDSLEINKLFQKFHQVDSRLSKKQKGTGLGLVLSKKLVELLGGEIFVESTLGSGTTFVFYIPLIKIEINKAHLKDAPPSTIKACSNGVILVADDEEYGRIAFRMMLENKYNLIFAESGKDVCDIAANKNIDIILMDIMMPGMDGITAFRNLRSSGINIPVIAVTGMAMDDEREKILSYGFNDYISKPVSEEKLVEIIETYLCR